MSETTTGTGGRALPDDGRAEIRILSADEDAAHAVWEKAAAAIGHTAEPRRRSIPTDDGVQLYATVDAPDRPLPGQQRDAAEETTGHLMDGQRITLDELSVHCSAAAVWLTQLARAAETPDVPVELADDIDSLRHEARSLRQRANRLGRLARIVEGDIPLAAAFPRGDGWGAAALDESRDDYGGPAVVPTANQLLHLADSAEYATLNGTKTLTYPAGMDGVPASIRKSWESKTAQARRQRERTDAVAQEVLRIMCERCGADNGEHCRTSTGRAAERAHTTRQREAEAAVDARLGYIGDNPVDVPEAR